MAGRGSGWYWTDRRVIGAAVLLACLLAAHQWSFFFDATLLSRALQNSLHIPAFAVLAFFIASAWRNLSVPVVFGICLLLALLLESTQIFTDRDASMVDLVSDAGGALLGLWIARGSRMWQVCGVVLLGVATLWMPLQVCSAYLQRDRIFPVLLDAGSVRSSLFSSNSDVSVMTEERGRKMLRVCWRDVQYPGVQMIEVVPDWSPFSRFVLDFEVEPAATGEAAAMTLVVAVGHAGVPGTSAYVPREFLPGRHRWELPRDVLDHGNAPISHLIVHSRPEHAGRCVRIAQAGLE